MIEINNLTKYKIDLDFYKKEINNILKFLNLNKKYLSIAIVGSDEIRKINNTYRHKDKATDVLSFPNIYINTKWDGKEFDETDLGEIIICYDVIKIQSKENKKTIQQEFLFMCLHGVLHLLGFEDEKTEDEYLEMERLQNFISTKIKSI